MVGREIEINLICVSCLHSLMIMRWWQLLLQALLLLCLLLPSSATAHAPAKGSNLRTGLLADPDVFKSNLQYIGKHFIPKGWKLNAAMKVQGACMVQLLQLQQYRWPLPHSDAICAVDNATLPICRITAL